MNSRITNHASLLSTIFYLLSSIFCFSATVTGTLQDISIQALHTKLMFAPTNNVLLTGTGLNAGPPKVIDTVNGAFSIILEAGDYAVSLPLIPGRTPFHISVFVANGTVNITNLLAPPHTYTYTNNLSADLLVSSSISVNGPQSYYDWSTLSNGVAALSAWNTGHGMARPPGLFFFNTNGLEMGSIQSWADHGSAANAPELMLLSTRSIALVPGGGGQFVNGLNGEIQIGYSAAVHDSSHIQYDDDPNTANWTDGLGSFASPNNVGHSKRFQFRSHSADGNFGIAAIMGFTGGDNATLADYNLVRSRLRFYSVSPIWGAGAAGFTNTPGIWVGEMGTNGWNLRGNLVQESAVASSGSAYILDLSKSFSQIVDVSASVVTFTTASLPTGATNFQTAHLLIRSGPFTPTLTFPSWRWGNEAGTAVAPSSLAAEKLLDIVLHAIGPDNTNILASYTVHPWPFAYDPDAQDFFTRASITDSAQKLAVHQLVLDAKAHGWWANCDAVYPFVGGTASSHSHNLKSSSYQITWTGTLTHDVTGDGSTGYGSTGYNFKNNGMAYSVNSARLFFYGGTTAPTDGGAFIGGYRWSGTDSRAGLKRNGVTIEVSGVNNSDGVAGAVSTGTDFRGPFIASRTAATTLAVGIRGSSWGTLAATTTVESPNTVCGLLARIDQSGTPDQFSNANLRGATLGAGLSQSQWNTFRADWDNFENVLGRKAP
jgi:hypothetical protein